MGAVIEAADMTHDLADLAPLPVGTRLVHIGPSKTGTTSLQAAMWAARDPMREQGVRFAGRVRQSETPVRAVVGLPSPFSSAGKPPPIRAWEELVRSIQRATEPRLVLSSEFLAHAREDAIRRIVADIDPDRIHVVVTLRPIARILASQWQQTVQAGSATSYDDWLDSLFNRPPGAREAPLWHRHRPDRLISRWAKVVGPGRLTAVVVDDRDHAYVLRAFEALLGLMPGTLQLQRDLANRSLTLAEVEALRAFNDAYLSAQLGRAMHTRLVRYDIASHLKQRQPGPDEERIETPRWALERAGEMAHDVVANLAASQVRIVGELSRLTDVPSSGREGDPARGVNVPPTIAAALSIGILIAGGFAQQPASPSEDHGQPDAVGSSESGALRQIPSRRVAKALYRRLRGAVRVRAHKTRRRIRRSSRSIARWQR